MCKPATNRCKGTLQWGKSLTRQTETRYGSSFQSIIVLFHFSTLATRSSQRNPARFVSYNDVEKIFDGMEDDITAYCKVNEKLLSTCVALLVTYNVGTVR